MIQVNKDGHLMIDGCNSQELVEQFGSPLYAYSETVISNQCKEIREDFLNKYPNTRAMYAAKAFLTTGFCKLLQREGLGIDVVSGGELYTAIKANIDPEMIEFNGNNKTEEEIRAALEYNIGRIIVDNPDELKFLESICREMNKKVKVIYRITPNVKVETHKYIQTAQKDSKFGFPLNEEIIYPAIKAGIDSDHINFIGFHFHIGSQLFQNEAYLKALDVVFLLMQETRRRYKYDITELNVGGGFGIKYLKSDEKKPYRYFLEPIMKKIDEFCKEHSFTRPVIVIEPGRSIVGEAGVTLYKVGNIKEIPNVKNYISIDGGMTDNLRVALYQSKYEVILANRAIDKKDYTASICGKCCESGDILITDAKIPKPKRGDILATFSTGAYGYSMSNNYNKNTTPAVVLCKEGQVDLLVKRQSYEKMIENEIIPQRLLK